jgi:hypothetical protein
MNPQKMDRAALEDVELEYEVQGTGAPSFSYTLESAPIGSNLC